MRYKVMCGDYTGMSTVESNLTKDQADILYKKVNSEVDDYTLVEIRKDDNRTPIQKERKKKLKTISKLNKEKWVKEVEKKQIKNMP